MLTHSGGFWYLFDNQGALVAIPDSKTDAARIYGHALLEDQDTSRKRQLQQAAKVKQAWDTYRKRTRRFMIAYFIGIGVFVALLVALLVATFVVAIYYS